MAQVVEGEILIDRPTEAVFDFVADERNGPRYNPNMVTSALIADGPGGRGSRFRAELRTGGRLLEREE